MALIYLFESTGALQALTSFKVSLQGSTNVLWDCVVLEVICKDTILSDLLNNSFYSLTNIFFSLSTHYHREYELFWGRIRKLLLWQTNPHCFARQILVALPEKSIWSSTFDQLDHHFFFCSWSPLGKGRARELVKWKTREKRKCTEK